MSSGYWLHESFFLLDKHRLCLDKEICDSNAIFVVVSEFNEPSS